MTANMRTHDFPNRMKSILENCADKRAWEGTRIGNLSRKDAVSLLGERVVAELDKKPFYVNCPQASDTSYSLCGTFYYGIFADASSLVSVLSRAV